MPETMKSIEEFAISTDIVARIALFAFVRSSTEDDIVRDIEAIREQLLVVYDEDDIQHLIDNYEKAALALRQYITD